jgi:hypothetical protein
MNQQIAGGGGLVGFVGRRRQESDQVVGGCVVWFNQCNVM